MKTLPALVFVAALAAFVVLPVNFVASLSALFAAGLLAILVSDYSHRPRGLSLRPARVIAMPAQRTERFGLAA